MTFPTDLTHGFRQSEFQTVGGADRNTGRFKPLVDTIHAIVALDDFSDFGVPLRGAPRAGRDTCLASDAQGMIHENDAVMGPFLHGAGWACGYTPGIFAVKAGHEDI